MWIHYTCILNLVSVRGTRSPAGQRWRNWWETTLATLHGSWAWVESCQQLDLRSIEIYWFSLPMKQCMQKPADLQPFVFGILWSSVCVLQLLLQALAWKKLDSGMSQLAAESLFPHPDLTCPERTCCHDKWVFSVFHPFSFVSSLSYHYVIPMILLSPMLSVFFSVVFL